MGFRSRSMRVLDLFCGLGGWSSAFDGYDIVGVDVSDFSGRFPGRFIQADLVDYTPSGYFDIIVASPPCEDFSKSSFPKTWKSVVRFPPDLRRARALFGRAVEIIREKKPEFWVIENVRASQKFVGQCDFHIGSRYFWSNVRFSVLDPVRDEIYGKQKVPSSRCRSELRALIPRSIAEAFRSEVERVCAEVVL